MSSAASAANAAIDHVRDWLLGSNGKWVTMGVPSDGSYGIPEGVMYGVPVITRQRRIHARAGLESTSSAAQRMDKTLAELEEERAGVAHLLWSPMRPAFGPPHMSRERWTDARPTRGSDVD